MDNENALTLTLFLTVTLGNSFIPWCLSHQQSQSLLLLNWVTEIPKSNLNGRFCFRALVLVSPKKQWICLFSLIVQWKSSTVNLFLTKYMSTTKSSIESNPIQVQYKVQSLLFHPVHIIIRTAWQRCGVCIINLENWLKSEAKLIWTTFFFVFHQTASDRKPVIAY